MPCVGAGSGGPPWPLLEPYSRDCEPRLRSQGLRPQPELSVTPPSGSAKQRPRTLRSTPDPGLVTTPCGEAPPAAGNLEGMLTRYRSGWGNRQKGSWRSARGDSYGILAVCRVY